MEAEKNTLMALQSLWGDCVPNLHGRTHARVLGVPLPYREVAVWLVSMI